jgi:hypothetical protein
VSKLTDKLDDGGRKYALNMIALWAAEQLGKRGEDANEFARDFLAKTRPQSNINTWSIDSHRYFWDEVSARKRRYSKI